MLKHPSLQNKTTDVVIHQHSRKLLKMDILMSETCWVHNKWNKIASDIKLVFHSSPILRVQESPPPQKKIEKGWKVEPVRLTRNVGSNYHYSLCNTQKSAGLRVNEVYIVDAAFHDVYKEQSRDILLWTSNSSRGFLSPTLACATGMFVFESTGQHGQLEP